MKDRGRNRRWRVLTPDALTPQCYAVVQWPTFHRIKPLLLFRKASTSNRSYFKSEMHTQTHRGIPVCIFVPIDVVSIYLLYSFHIPII